MAYTIEFPDGKVKNIYDDGDFENAIEERMGYESAKYYHDKVSEMEQDIEDRIYGSIESKCMDLCTGECDRCMLIREHYNNVLKDILSELKAIQRAEWKYAHPRHEKEMDRLIDDIEGEVI